MGEKIKKDNKPCLDGISGQKARGTVGGRVDTNTHAPTHSNSDFPGSQSGKVYVSAFTGASKSYVHVMTFKYFSYHVVQQPFTFFKVFCACMHVSASVISLPTLT